MNEGMADKKGAPELSPEAQEEAFKTLAEASKSSASVDGEHHKSNTEALKSHSEVLKEGMAKAESADERMAYARMSQQSFKQHHESAEKVTDRAHSTQRGAMTITGIALIGAAVVGAGILTIGARAVLDKFE